MRRPPPRATRDARPRQLPTDTSHAVPTRECQSDPPSLPRNARHPTPAQLSATPRRALTFRSMSVVRPEEVVQLVEAGDGRLVAEGAVGSASVVPVDPAGQPGSAFGAGAVEGAGSP